MHGTIDVAEETFALDDDQEKFIQFICFLATLKFKLHHIYSNTELGNHRKQNQCKYICNILFLFLQYCEPRFLYYPLRALAEFLSQEQTEKALSKRLNSENLLQYKMGKDVVIEEMLIDFSKMSLGKISSMHKSSKNMKEALRETAAFAYLYDDIERFLGDAMQRVGDDNKVECGILCLRMISELLKTRQALYRQKTGKTGPDHEFSGVDDAGLSLYVNALVNVEKLLAVGSLTEQDKEVYYSEVKNLIKIIKWN